MSEPSVYEKQTGHRADRHESCERVACMVCDLFICSICGALEGALLPKCPGRQLTFEEHNVNYKHYCDGTGPFAAEQS
jgi:hypothetical protein